MSSRSFCDRIVRRDLLRFGAVGAFGSSLSLPQLLAHEDAVRGTSASSRSGRSLIIVFLQGGLSTIDTWDMKPDAPLEFRGEFNPISTNVAGTQICEHLPRLALQMDKFALVRSFMNPNSDHGPADHYLLTGHKPGPGFNGGLKPNNQRPAHGAVIAKQLGPRGSVPPYVCLPKMHNSGGSAYLGSGAAPFVVDADPNAPGFTVPDLMPPVSLRADRLDSRRQLLSSVSRLQRSADAAASQSAQAMTTWQQRAIDLMTSDATRAAFDIGSEPDGLRDEYGRHSLGQSCLLARRLVEAGVRCVLIDHTNWDTHYSNFSVLKEDLLPHLDSAMSTLFRDLDDRGLLDSTMVLVTGEFGRTPRINKDAGRDHWGPSTAIAIGGAGIRGGLVVGASNERAEKPATEPWGPEDLAATIYHAMGIDPATMFHTAERRPMPIVPGGGRVIAPLFG